MGRGTKPRMRPPQRPRKQRDRRMYRQGRTQAHARRPGGPAVGCAADHVRHTHPCRPAAAPIRTPITARRSFAPMLRADTAARKKSLASKTPARAERRMRRQEFLARWDGRSSFGAMPTLTAVGTRSRLDAIPSAHHRPTNPRNPPCQPIDECTGLAPALGRDGLWFDPLRGIELGRRLDVRPHPIPRRRATDGRNQGQPQARPARAAGIRAAPPSPPAAASAASCSCAGTPATALSSSRPGRTHR